jgi:hypothetical protein
MPALHNQHPKRIPSGNLDLAVILAFVMFVLQFVKNVYPLQPFLCFFVPLFGGFGKPFYGFFFVYIYKCVAAVQMPNT